MIVAAVIFGSKKVNNINLSPAEFITDLTGAEIIMKIMSPAFGNAAKIPQKYTCDGADVLPPLQISGVPSAAKSLAIIMDDPDSPSGTWLHWSVWNIGPGPREISEGKIPSGAIEGKTSFDSVGYGGPCPGRGEHRYFFRLYALDTMLDLPSGANRGELEAATQGHILDQAEFYGLYKRAER